MEKRFEAAMFEDFRSMSNMEFIEHLVSTSKFGALSQFFVIEAISKYAEQVASSSTADWPTDHLINFDQWINLAKEIKQKVDLKYGA